MTPWPDGWSLHWWVGADDRRHRAADEAAVRQRLVDDMPVVETAMRVPGGDAVQRVFATRSAGSELVVVEVENRSPVPVALGLVVEADGRVEWRDPTTLMVDGRVALLVPRPAARTEPHETFVWPVPHRTTFRVVLPLAAAHRSPALPGTLPSSDQVARGWRRQGDRGMRLVLPDERLQSAVDANRRFLLLHHQRDGIPGRDAGQLVAVLDRYGYAGEAPDVVRARPDRPPRRWFRRADPPALGLERLTSLLDDASPTWTWPEAVPGRLGAELLNLVRDLLLREPGRGELALCSVVPEPWLGQGIEVHDAPTHLGHLSFAVRWHGDRPALLWELEPGAGAVRLTAPGLDPGWSSTERRGDALLAPRLPATPVTLKRRG